MQRTTQTLPPPPKLKTPLWPKQRAAIASEATEILYGGAAGGGKSHLMRWAAIIWCMAVPGLQVYFFRRILDDLIKNHIEGPRGFRVILAPLVASGHVTIIEDEIRFWNGAKIYLCHCQHDKHRFKYQGAEIHVLIIDELTHFSEVIYRFLRGRVRAVGLQVPESLKGMFPRILCGSNPGNIGHLWVKSTFIDDHAPLDVWRAPESEGGMVRQFIPAQLRDNPSMTRDDPGYVGRLKGLGSEQLVRAMLEGDWEIVEGAYFDCWATKKHVIRPFAIPKHWTRFRSMDWGSFHPFSIHWWAVASEDYELEQDGETVLIPQGSLIAYREWYGAKKGVLNRGIKMIPGTVAEGILEREREERRAGLKFAAFPCDPAMFNEDGGPSKAEKMGDKGVYCDPGDNERVAGWTEMRARLVGEDGRPLIYFFNTCYAAIRTIPALMHDEHKPEDVDTKGEDHAGDDVRYMCMARPWATKAKKSTKTTRRGRYDPEDRIDDDDEDDDTDTRRTARTS